MEIFEDVFGRWISFDHAIRTNFARPNPFIRLRDRFAPVLAKPIRPGLNSLARGSLS